MSRKLKSCKFYFFLCCTWWRRFSCAAEGGGAANSSSSSLACNRSTSTSSLSPSNPGQQESTHDSSDKERREKTEKKKKKKRERERERGRAHGGRGGAKESQGDGVKQEGESVVDEGVEKNWTLQGIVVKQAPAPLAQPPYPLPQWRPKALVPKSCNATKVAAVPLSVQVLDQAYLLEQPVCVGASLSHMTLVCYFTRSVRYFVKKHGNGRAAGGGAQTAVGG